MLQPCVCICLQICDDQCVLQSHQLPSQALVPTTNDPAISPTHVTGRHALMPAVCVSLTSKTARKQNIHICTCCNSMYVQKYVLVQQGDMLAVSPYESHHDPRFFQPHPARYDPNRGGLHCPGSSLHEVSGISGMAGLVFGGGRYRSALTLRHPRWSMQHHISCKHEPTMQRHLRKAVRVSSKPLHAAVLRFCLPPTSLMYA